MLGLGSFGNGGSSSSFSNLSPLAPPFTVDRSNSKPSSNQILNFNDSSSYSVTVPFPQSWPYADPAGYNFFPKHEMVADSLPTTHTPEFSPTDSAVTPTSSTLWSTSNPTAKTSPDSYSFGCEGYYPSYVSPVGGNDATAPFVAFSEPSFEVPVNASSQVDYTQSLSGLEYPVSHWSVWTRVAHGKQDEKKGIDGSFSSLGNGNGSASFAYMSCLSQGNAPEGVNVTGEDSCALSGNFPDRAYTGLSNMGLMDDKSYLAQEPVYPSFNSKTDCLGSIPSVPSQSGLSLGSSKNFLNYENPFTPREKMFQPLDSCLHDTTSSSKSSPQVVIRPAPSGSCFLTQKTGLQKPVDACNTGASNSEKSDLCGLLKREEFRLSIGSPVEGFSLDTSPLNYGMDDQGRIVFAPLSGNNHCSSIPRVSDKMTVEESSGSQAPYNSVPTETFTVKCSDALDLHNPNVDSPCWKGAPASRIALYDSVEGPSPCHSKRKLEYSDFDQSNPIFPTIDNSGRTSSNKLCEDNLHDIYVGVGLSALSGGTGTSHIIEEHRTDVTKKTIEHVDPGNNSRVLKFSEDLNKPSKGYDLSQYSGNDCQQASPCGKPLSAKEQKHGPPKHSLTEGYMPSGLNLNVALEGVVALDTAENVLRSPASQEDAKQALPYQVGSKPNLDVGTLVNTIHNLSELLKYQCLTNACLLEEQDHDVLKHAIANLGECTSKKIEKTEAISSQNSNFGKSGKSYGSCMGIQTGHPQFMDEITLDSQGLGYELMHQDKTKNYGKKAEKTPILTPFKDDFGDSKEQVAQAIKKVLDDNFICDEEMQPQAFLFKNLWLEAEAKLCSLSYKARFDHMKIEMEKLKVCQGKDSNLKSSVAPEGENDLASKTTTQSPSTSSNGSHIDNTEDSVMERFNILNRREEKLSSSFVEEEKDSAFVGGENAGSVLTMPNLSRQQGNVKSSFMEERKASDVIPCDVNHSVMERFNILRQLSDNLRSPLREEENKDQDVVSDDTEDSVMTRLNILRQRGDNLNPSFLDKTKDPELVASDAEDSIMARLNVLKRREDNPNLPKDLDKVAAGSADLVKQGLLKGEDSEGQSQRRNVVIEPYFYHHSVNATKGNFGSYVDASGYDSVKQFHLSVADDPIILSNRNTRLGNQQSSGLHETSSSDWEHVAKDEFVVWQSG